MSWTNRVVWQEGMFLRTQHFQQQDRWTEQLVRGWVQALRPHPWGLIDYALDRDLLGTGRFALASATGVFEDGTPFALPGETDHPPPLELPESARNVLVYLALPVRQGGAVEVADSATEGRYTAKPFEAYDTQSASPQPAELQVGRLRLRYLAETEERTGYLSIPLARVTEVTADRRIMLDDRWMPPALVCSAAAPLSGLVAELAGMLNQRGEALAARMTAPGQAGVAQVADFLLLQSINGWQNVLAHWADAATSIRRRCTPHWCRWRASSPPSWRRGGRIHTRRIGMTTCSAALPRWSRICGDRCRRCWRRQRFAIPLRDARHGVRVGPITDRSILRASNFVLTVQADVQAEQLRRLFPHR